MARRAGGSMRDSQSLLEQLLSFGSKNITATDVHDMLGTTDLTRLFAVLDKIAAKDAAAALAEFAEALRSGADIGTLWDQLLGLLRDLMVVAVGGDDESLLHALPSDFATVQTLGERLGLETILAMVQIVDQTLARLRYLSQPRTLAEVAIVRMCRLADLQAVAQLAGALRNNTLGNLTLRISGNATAALPADSPTRSSLPNPPAPQTESAASLKKNERSDDQPVTPPSDPSVSTEKLSDTASPPPTGTEITTEPPQNPTQNSVPNDDLLATWRSLIGEMPGMAGENGRCGVPATLGPNSLVLRFSKRYNFQKTYCDRPENMAVFQSALALQMGRPIQIGTAFAETDDSPPPPSQPAREEVRRTTQERLKHPFVQRAVERFSARVQRVDEPKTPSPTATS
ncbi:MAG: hypothetical protein QM811_24085 [Pirellulales bacterium]